MIRIKQAIPVGNNITDIMCLPCVNKCEKVDVEYHVCGVEWNTEIRHKSSFVFTLDNGQRAYCGDWIVNDGDGHWSVLTDEEYEQYKYR